MNLYIYGALGFLLVAMFGATYYYKDKYDLADAKATRFETAYTQASEASVRNEQATKAAAKREQDMKILNDKLRRDLDETLSQNKEWADTAHPAAIGDRLRDTIPGHGDPKTP